MAQQQFVDHLAISLVRSQTRRKAVQQLVAALGIGTLVQTGVPVNARRRKRKKRGRGGLGLGELCTPGKDSCKGNLKCDSPTTRHTCSSTVEGIDTWCCVPPGGKCTECECCGDYACDFGEANPEGACIRNDEG